MHPFPADRLWQTALGFRASKALHFAVELGLFTELGRGPRTARQLCRSLGLNEDAAPDLLDALVAMGVLAREGDDARAVYLNTREAGHFLDQRSPASIGALLADTLTRQHLLWDTLSAAFKVGAERTDDAAVPGPQPLTPAGALSASELSALAEHFDLSTHRTLVCIDADGEPLARALTARFPQLVCQRVGLHDPFPRVEVIVMAGALCACGREAKLALLRRARAALPEGGCLIATATLIDDARRHNLFALLASINSRLETQGGFGFSGADFDGWCLDVGFRRTEAVALCASSSAVAAFV